MSPRHTPSASIAPAYTGRLSTAPVPTLRMPEDSMDPQAAYRFRYDGLRLILQAGDQYLFLPQAWTRAGGVAILMPRNDSLRLEFVPASARGTMPRSTC